MGGRVPWVRLEGGDVESIVGMLICSQFTNAVRVRPSQGDGGVDIFVPGEGGFAEERIVYQVKKYTENLTAGQKTKITNSFNRVVAASGKEGWRLAEWHLVMPLDLTDHNLANWLRELTEDAEFPCETHGLLFCDTYASRYPNVVDYYHRDGKERLDSAMERLTQVISGREDRRRGDPLSPVDVATDLAAIHHALNEHDPFYRYDFAVSDGPPPDQPPLLGEPGLVGVYGVSQGSTWITIKIFARSREAAVERPIKGHFTVSIPPENDELREEFSKFVDYGAPVSMPPGTVHGLIDLPGGLGGDISGASLQVLSAPTIDPSESADLVLAIIAPDTDAVLASTKMRRIEVTSGEVGIRSVLADEAELFTVEVLVKSGLVDTGQMTLRVDYHLAGRRPADLVDGMSVLYHWHTPNRIAFGLAYGPPNYGVVATSPNEPDPERQRWAPICEALGLIQEHVPKLIKMPATMDFKQAMQILDVAKLVSGETTTGRLSGDFTVTHPSPATEIPRELHKVYDFKIIKTTKFTLDDEVITVGKHTIDFSGQFARIRATESELKPLTTGVAMRYDGDLPPGYVQARPFLNVPWR